MTQGDPVYPTILNIVIYWEVRTTLLEFCGLQEAHHGLGWDGGEQDIVFYDDDGRITGRNPICVQGLSTTCMRMFEWVVLYTNLGKTK